MASNIYLICIEYVPSCAITSLLPRNFLVDVHVYKVNAALLQVLFFAFQNISVQDFADSLSYENCLILILLI